MTVPPLVAPGRGGGLHDVVRRRYLLRLLVRRELRSRYQGSLLGLGWSYVRPAVNFAVYFFVVGIFLKMSKAIPNFPVFLFSGMVLVSFFTETLITTAWSVVGNASLVKKVYLPRELFPVSSMLVSGVHMLPALGVLMGGAVWAGWTPSWVATGSIVLAFAIVAALAMAFGLLFAAVNVFFRDFGQVVDIINIVVPWSVPMIYPWTTVQEAAHGGWPLQVYLANPLTSAVLLFERAFWWPTNDQAATLPNGAPALPGGLLAFPYHLTVRGLVSLLAALLLLAVAQLVFARLQRRFAQEL
ncbi:ABC transporter permease [Actinoallomurus iriomotensis]|uniref:Transport permease protein n=1 Tax=Actinoallomurus iriomotensis TaxID=478107 RepID=A0A9W6VJ24_9ACTN|nr:ABC transporter permease [Actinoallomurus iriomotensis]GLY73583.1 transport permease protein [Actinoallomurus iriomotensis]